MTDFRVPQPWPRAIHARLALRFLANLLRDPRRAAADGDAGDPYPRCDHGVVAVHSRRLSRIGRRSSRGPMTAPELEAKAIFEELMARHPERYGPGRLRTLQRRVRRWRLHAGLHAPSSHDPKSLSLSAFASLRTAVTSLASCSIGTDQSPATGRICSFAMVELQRLAEDLRPPGSVFPGQCEPG